jgi:holo-[acyl-carrier protein] synthase
MNATSGRIRTGCDITELADIEYSVKRFGDRYLRKVFASGEIASCTGPDRVARLAARFAAKEATIKAFASPNSSFALPEIEVSSDGPVPKLRLSGAAARLAEKQGWTETALTLSHADCHAMAVLMVICSENG